MKKTPLLALLLTLFATIYAASAHAAVANCKPIYGGGITTEQVCDGKRVTVAGQTQTRTQTQATPTPKKSPTTTKGGLSVGSKTTQRSTPSTGPEVFGLVALLPAAGLGLYLRKKNL